MNFYVKKLQRRRNSLEGTKRTNSMFERLISLVKFLQENFIHTRLSRNTRAKEEKTFRKRKFYTEEHGSFVLDLNVANLFAKDSDLLKEYFLRVVPPTSEKTGGAKLVGRAVAALSIDPQTHST